MSNSLIITLIIFSLFLALITTLILRKGDIPVKYALLWYFSSGVVFILALFPFIIKFIADLLGFKTLSNLIIGIIISVLIFISMSLTIITSHQKKKITLLIQEVSLIKSERNKRK